MYFRMLGPIHIEVRASGLGRPLPPQDGNQGTIQLPGRRNRTILALLLLDVGNTVSVDRVVDAIWTTAPPATAVAQVQNCAAALRRVLQSARCEGHPARDCRVSLITDGHGYRLEADPLTVDAVRFRAAVDECLHASPGSDEQVASRLRAALALWKGTALGGLASMEVQAEAARLEELRLVALEEVASRELRLTRTPAVHAADLLALTHRYPYRERLWLLHMEALHRCGRTSEALARFRKYREMLVAEHGIEPGQEIRAKERELLQERG